MVEFNHESENIVINIPKTMINKDESQEVDQSSNYKILERTNIEPILVERNTEYGYTKIQSLGFLGSDQGKKIITLLDNPILYNKLMVLLEYIKSLGGDSVLEKRYFAAKAVERLVLQRSFHTIKDKVILPWAKDDNGYCQDAATRSLTLVLNQKSYEDVVLKLLGHWLTSDNDNLARVAFITYCNIGPRFPHKVLEDINKFLLSKKDESILYYSELVDNLSILYSYYPGLVLGYLHDWLLAVDSLFVQWIATVFFLLAVDIKDIVLVDNDRDITIEIVFNLWDNPKLLNDADMQSVMTQKIKNWAEQSLKRQSETTEFNYYKKFFYELYGRYETQRRNRLEFHVRKWQRNLERQRAFEARKGRQLSTSQINGSFFDLIPKK